MSKILVTGAAGFIGFHVSRLLLERGDQVIGLDSLNDYYDVSLKRSRLSLLEDAKGFQFVQLDLVERERVADWFAKERPEKVVHLAAQAGVRYSLTHPHVYVNSNLVAFVNVLEGCRQQQIGHLVYASSSSVYGGNTKLPFSVEDNVDHPVSLYAATKKANELLAHTYSHLFRLPTTGLRFFTVYGPWGRPDMAIFLFTQSILEGRPIDVFNSGRMQRDFTYIDDVADAVVRVLDRAAEADPHWTSDAPAAGSSDAPYRIYNVGNRHPVQLLDLIEILERHLGRKAKKNLLPMQPGDVPTTFASLDGLERDFDFRPTTPIDEGVANFVDWYRDYHQVQ